MEKMKRKSTIGICILLCTVILIMCLTMATGCERQLTCKEYLAELVKAESFSVKNGDQTILNYSENKLYWRDEYAGKYDEYYLYPDNSGKKWVYNKDFSSDSWIKMAMTDSEYGNYLIMIKRSLGLYERLMDIVENISLNFDSYMVKKDDKYVLKPNTIEYVELELWVDGNILYASLKNAYLGDSLLSFSDLNKTEVSLSTEAQAATIGTVLLP